MDVTAIKPEIAEAVKTVLAAHLEKSVVTPEAALPTPEVKAEEVVVESVEDPQEVVEDGIVDIVELPKIEDVVLEEVAEEVEVEAKVAEPATLEAPAPTELSVVLGKLAALEATLESLMQRKVEEVKKSFEAKLEEVVLKSEQAADLARSQVEALEGTVSKQEALICDLKTLPNVRKSFDASVMVRPEPSDIKAQKPLSRDDLTLAAVDLFKAGKLTADEARHVSIYGSVSDQTKQGMLIKAARK